VFGIRRIPVTLARLLHSISLARALRDATAFRSLAAPVPGLEPGREKELGSLQLPCNYGGTMVALRGFQGGGAVYGRLYPSLFHLLHSTFFLLRRPCLPFCRHFGRPRQGEPRHCHGSAAVPSRSTSARGRVSEHLGSVAWSVLLRLGTARAPAMPRKLRAAAEPRYTRRGRIVCFAVDPAGWGLLAFAPRRNGELCDTQSQFWWKTNSAC
jgi:hypothetical protein